MPQDRRSPRLKDARAPTTPKRCLRCDATFGSQGPHHRLCEKCRDRDAYGEGYAAVYRLHLHAIRRGS